MSARIYADFPRGRPFIGIRQKNRLAINSGRKSGHGHVILFFLFVLPNMWWSPATVQIDRRLESTEMTNQGVADGAEEDDSEMHHESSLESATTGPSSPQDISLRIRSPS